MMIGGALRRYGFWTLDLLKGAQVRKYYQDIKYALENDNKEGGPLSRKRTN